MVRSWVRSPYPGWHYVPYNDMTPEQQEQARQNLVCKALPEAALPDWQFLVEDSTGRVTKAKGRHKMTEVAEENYRKITPPIPRSTDPVGDKAKGALDGFSCGKFTLARG